MKFILTKELGRLSIWLRILGYDTVYFKEDNRSKLIISALRDGRIILTRNRRLSGITGVKTVIIKHDEVKDQLKQAIEDLQLNPSEQEMFSRCTVCNEALKPIDKEKIKEKVPEYVFQTQNAFYCCMICQRVYWQGTHWGNVKNCLEEISKND